MQTQSNCLQEAMFIASESYSGSSYSTKFSEAINSLHEICDEALAFLPTEDLVITAASYAA